ncbi:MAG: hypothetical protein KGD64_09920 [Candidatus Heimdallarchaeota archaeon]|nr:hypothetical protein [Candidatus Heimdallarchaeota archaeon]
MTNNEVIIRGDIISSRRIKDKENFWVRLNQVISGINKEYSNELKFQLELFSGDAITGICSNKKAAFTITSRFIELLLPYKIRMVISEGEIDYQRKTMKLSELDGEVFWKASIEIDKLKEKKRYFSVITGQREDPIMSSLADIISELKYEWTPKEKEINHLYDLMKNQNEVATKLGISQQSVSDGLRRSKYKQIRKAEQTLIDFI